MTKFFKRGALAAALALASVASAQAATTVLTFSHLLDYEPSFTYNNTVGGKLKVTATGGKLAIVGGELGVADLKHFDLDPRLGKQETITFSFDKAVNLIAWDLDDLPFFSNEFSIKVDSNAAQTFSLDSFSPGSTSLQGKTFTFGYKGDSYFIDTLKFSSVTAVPEPAAGALILSGLAVAGLIARRRNKAA
jgi:hypothetical protein